MFKANCLQFSVYRYLYFRTSYQMPKQKVCLFLLLISVLCLVLMLVIVFEQGFLKSSIKSTIEKDLISNSFFIRKNNKKKTTDDCKKLKFYIF